MKLAALVLVSLVAAPMSAFAAKPCEELKGEIAQRIDAKGVVGYTLDIVAPDAVGERKVVGSCDGGQHRIVYVRDGQPSAVVATPVAPVGTPDKG